jgi:hypothetical protein
VKITRKRLTKLIREAGLADIRDSTLDWYTDHNGRQRMVPGGRNYGKRKTFPTGELASFVDEIIEYTEPEWANESDESIVKRAIWKVVDEEGASYEDVKEDVRAAGKHKVWW